MPHASVIRRKSDSPRENVRFAARLHLPRRPQEQAQIEDDNAALPDLAEARSEIGYVCFAKRASASLRGPV